MKLLFNILFTRPCLFISLEPRRSRFSFTCTHENENDNTVSSAAVDGNDDDIVCCIWLEFFFVAIFQIEIEKFVCVCV